MAADITYGSSLERREVTDPTGCVFTDIVPIGGGYDHFSYSSVVEMKKAAQALGVDWDAWPDFCNRGITSSLVSLDEVAVQNERIRRELEKLKAEDVAGNRYLATIWRIVQEGKVFFIV